VHEDRKGQLAFKLGCRSGKDEVVASLSLGCELGEQTRLADPRLADELERARAAIVELVQCVEKQPELLGSPQQKGRVCRLIALSPVRYPRLLAFMKVLRIAAGASSGKQGIGLRVSTDARHAKESGSRSRVPPRCRIGSTLAG
jgi:hypothetical protein